MDGVTYQSVMTPEVVGSGVLADDPFVLVDVGCGLGIESLWRVFEPSLRVEAFDPQLAEIERLREAETNPAVHYHAALVGLPDDHPYNVQRAQDAGREAPLDLWPRLSTRDAIAAATSAGPTDLEETNDWERRTLATEKVELAAALAGNEISNVDFVKTDTDGADLEILLSLEPAIDRLGVLGFLVETPFVGSELETSHTFHNVDRFMRRHGFMLHTLTVNRYSRSALPAPFVYRLLAQTTWGQAIWGDVVYLRDGGLSETRLAPTKLLKLACLAELFLAPDVAAEILLVHRASLAPLVPVDRLLDLLTPALDGEQVSYTEYVAAFKADPTSFYPAEPAETDVVAQTEHPAHPIGSRLKRAVGR